ncbi:hypothetical protein HDU78_007317 [Chytriomyces hyalinus]|nr:hypothetical protein HDU78_007317 [Chytriomyces hyalinus]
MSNPQVGDHVEVLNAGAIAVGTVAYVGETEFAAGVWVGIVLHAGVGGKNDGSVQGVRYFECEQGAGVFMRVSQIRSVVSSPVPNHAKSPTGSTSSKTTANSTSKSSKPPLAFILSLDDIFKGHGNPSQSVKSSSSSSVETPATRPSNSTAPASSTVKKSGARHRQYINCEALCQLCIHIHQLTPSKHKRCEGLIGWFGGIQAITHVTP